MPSTLDIVLVAACGSLVFLLTVAIISIRFHYAARRALCIHANWLYTRTAHILSTSEATEFMRILSELEPDVMDALK
jgi:hypothetical protein